MQYQLSETSEMVNDVITKAGDIHFWGEKHRSKSTRLTNLLVYLKTQIKSKDHGAKLSSSQDRDCNHCRVPETVNTNKMTSAKEFS